VQYYWSCPIASAATLDVQGLRKKLFQSDTATFIQDRGQVPFEPQSQRTFSVDKKSNHHVQRNSAQTSFYWAVVPHRPPISPFPESAGPIASDHPLLVSLQSVLGSELSGLIVPKTSECASLSHTPVDCCKQTTTSMSHIEHKFILPHTMKNIPSQCQVTNCFSSGVPVLLIRLIQGTSTTRFKLPT
jgi:hypothetical protein